MNIKINVDKKDLLFINVPDIYENFVIENFNFAGTWIKETDSKSLNHWKMKIPNGNYEVLGFMKDVLLDDFKSDNGKNFVLRKV